MKWFNVQKGYGFIEPTEGTGDFFVHQADIYAPGFRSRPGGQGGGKDCASTPRAARVFWDGSEGWFRKCNSGRAVDCTLARCSGLDGLSPCGTQVKRNLVLRSIL